MASSTAQAQVEHLEFYLEVKDYMPDQLKRTFKQINELDGKAQSILKKIGSKEAKFLEIALKPKTEKVRKQYEAEIDKLYGEVLELRDQKVQLATQNLKLVDKHLAELDSRLAQMKPNDASEKVEVIKAEVNTAKVNKGEVNKEEFNKEEVNKGEVNKSTPARRTKRKKRKSKRLIEAEEAAPVPSVKQTFCICKRGEKGVMIACDDQKCDIEWYHTECLGLTTIPGENEIWYCPTCQAQRNTVA